MNCVSREVWGVQIVSHDSTNSQNGTILLFFNNLCNNDVIYHLKQNFMQNVILKILFRYLHTIKSYSMQKKIICIRVNTNTILIQFCEL